MTKQRAKKMHWSDSGPLRPAFAGGLSCNIRVSSVSGAPSVPAVQTYTGETFENSAFGCLIQRRMRRKLCLDSGTIGSGRLRAGAGVFVHHELRPREFRKTAAFRHQFIESSVLDHAPMIEHQDTRGIADRGKTMRDHEGGTALHHFVEGR